MNYNHCHLVEEAERLKAKLRAGTMHQAGRPGGGHLRAQRGAGGLSDPGPGSAAEGDAWESAMGTEAVWVTVADESSWDVLRAVTPKEKALVRAFAS